MAGNDEIDFIFFDIGGSLGERTSSNDLKPFPSSIRLLQVMRDGMDITRCLFVGESLIEVLGAIAAGMKAVLKPCPPGRDLG